MIRLYFLLSIIFFSSAFAQNSKIDERFRTPRLTMMIFIESMERVKEGDSGKIKDAILTLDLSLIDMGSRNLVGKLTAERLINTIDRISKVDFDSVPNYESGATWYFRKQSINVNGAIKDVEIALYKTESGWKFTPQTVLSIEDFYHSVEDLKVVSGVTEFVSLKTKIKNMFPHWTGKRFFVLKNGQWLSLVVLGLFSIFIYFIVRFLIGFVVKNKSEVKERYKSTLPFGILASSLFVKYTVIFLELDIEFLEIILRINYIVLAFSAVWSSLKLVDYVSFEFEKKALISPNKFDDVLVPMLKKTAKVFVVSFGALFVAHSMTFDVASILAGLGIGGVAVALAAKDTISNLFGSVTVILDRPFNIGDYIVLDKNIEGTVEQVGFRSTRIRTPINSLVSMPNSVLANLAIDNYGMRNYRRFRTVLGIEYTTKFEDVENFIQEVRYRLGLNPNVEKEEMPIQVYVHELGESSINILLNIYLKAVSAKDELEERHNIILEIMKIANNTNINFAYPTRTLFMKKE